jgi:hypothetical protein
MVCRSFFVPPLPAGLAGVAHPSRDPAGTELFDVESFGALTFTVKTNPFPAHIE